MLKKIVMRVKKIILETSHNNFIFTEKNIDEIHTKGYKAINIENSLLLVFLRWGAEISSEFSLKNYFVMDRFDAFFGGSACISKLVFTDNYWKMLKQYNFKSKLQIKDSLERHVEEAKWITSKDIIESDLFPNCSYEIKKKSLQIKSDFIPSNTLGEVLWESQSNAYEISDFIGKIFTKLNSNLYIKKTSFQGECYISKIKRRWQNLKTKSNLPIWSDLEKKKIIINNKEFNSLEDILNDVRYSANYIPLNMGSSFMCHGDLIPEDILVDIELNNFLLIDPNPQNTDPFCDWSKILMSLYLYYELAIRNQIIVDQNISGKSIRVNYYFNLHTSNYRKLIDEVLIQLLLEDSRFITQLSFFNNSLKKKSLFLNAGLMAIAIVPFHILEHNNLSRSLYFYSRGIELINLGL